MPSAQRYRPHASRDRTGMPPSEQARCTNPQDRLHPGSAKGDILNLLSVCTSVVFDPKSQKKFLALTFRKTKTSRSCQPYVLHLPMEGDGEVIHLLATERKEANEPFLFLDAVNAKDDGEKTATLARIKEALRKVSILSIRRGGLQAMALAGMTTATLLAHSRHRRIENLHRCLEWGTVFLEATRERFALGESRYDCQRTARGKGACAVAQTDWTVQK
jgi:hypothetical protein